MAKKRKRRESQRPPNQPMSSGEKGKNIHANKSTSPSSSPASRKDNTSNLAQRLKKHRGVAANSQPPPIWKDTNSTQRSFLTPQNDPQAFQSCLDTSYKGFQYESPSELPDALHKQFDSSFRGLGDLFLYDTIQPGKKRLTRTSVTRTLVGAPGSTYKYLGLRLFSHPWIDVDKEGDAITFESSAKKSGSTLRKLGYSDKITSALIEMGRANNFLKERSNEMLEKYVAPHVVPRGLVGSADYNLTLVNKMASTSIKRDLKKENAYGMGKVSVGWHRDSGLKDFSSIAVYQSLEGLSTHTKTRVDWGVALRAMDGGAGGPLASVPALMVPLPSGSVYYMFDEFNHNHEHAVIAGSDGVRYSSTHRVAREGQGTWQYIRDKTDQFCASASKFDFARGTAAEDKNDSMSMKKVKEKFVSIVRAQQLLMNEIEFEWLRQWFVQGEKHSLLHKYWHQPMERLCDSFCRLDKLSVMVVSLLREQASCEDRHISEDLYDVLIECLTERSKLRNAWNERYADPVFEEIAVEERPMTCPCLDRNQTANFDECSNDEQMPDLLDALIAQIRDWRSAFVKQYTGSLQEPGQAITQSKKKKRKKASSGSLTRKEQKRVASNWEKLKKHI